jgi:hypothetical protein
MTPGFYDFDLVRGSTSPFVFELFNIGEEDSEVPLVFDDVRLTVTANDGTLILRATVEDGTLTLNSEGNEITWTPTAAQSRLLALGPKNKYEVEVRISGTQEVWLMGTITGLGGINDD